MLKCRPSKAAHCSSLKSFFCLEQGSELQERNFIRRPTQYFPPFLGLGREREGPRHVKRDTRSVRNTPLPRERLQKQSAHGKKNFQEKAPRVYLLFKEKT